MTYELLSPEKENSCRIERDRTEPLQIINASQNAYTGKIQYFLNDF